MENKLKLIFELDVEDTSNVKEIESIMKECLCNLNHNGIKVDILRAYTQKIKIK